MSYIRIRPIHQRGVINIDTRNRKLFIIAYVPGLILTQDLLDRPTCIHLYMTFYI